MKALGLNKQSDIGAGLREDAWPLFQLSWPRGTALRPERVERDRTGGETERTQRKQ